MYYEVIFLDGRRTAPAISYRAHLTQQIQIARRTLLGVMIMTIINIVLLLIGGGNYLLFSASVPYYLTWFGFLMDGGIGSYTYTGLILAAAILAVYALLWLLSRKNTVLLTWAAVLLGIDLAALIAVTFLLFESPFANLVDILFHIVLIWQIQKGAKAGKELPTAPEEITFIEVTDDDLGTNSHF